MVSNLRVVLESELTADESLHCLGVRESRAVDCARRHGYVVHCKAFKTFQFNLSHNQQRILLILVTKPLVLIPRSGLHKIVTSAGNLMLTDCQRNLALPGM